MTDTDREKWERVAKRIGKWKPKQKCNCDEFSDPDADLDGQRWCEACHFLALDPRCPVVPHDIPCPDPSDPAMIVAMIEWQTSEYDVPMFDEESRTTVFVPDQHHTEIWFGEDNLWHARIDHWAETGTAPTLHAALIDAIDALPQEVRN